MTSASTITIFADGLIATIACLVLVGAVIIGVTARTIRLERSVLPGDDLCILLMAFRAIQIAAMVEWFERCRRVAELVRNKRIGVMAAVTLLTRTEVTVVLTNRDHVVVTGRTGAEYLGVIDIECRRPDRRRMTVLTHVRCKSVLRILARCDCAIVATETIAGDVGMVIICGQPGDGRMAVIAVVTARDVGWVLAGCGHAVVTGAATAKYLRVIDSDRRHPNSRVVAVLANVRCQNVSRILARRCNAVVTVAAAARDIGVVKVCGQPAGRCMAVLANITAGNMHWRLARRRHTVMTTAAVADDANVIKVCRYPAGRRMAVVTGIAARHMCWCLAGRYSAVMARAAAADDLRMIDTHHRAERDDAVTVLTNRSGLNMRCVLTGRVGTVMAAHAITRNVDVIKVRRDPGVCRMAIVTGLAARDVRRRLAGRNVAVVTGLTTADDLGVIDHCHWRPKIDAMAVFANGGRLNVRRVFADGFCSIVATGTVGRNTCVIEVRRRPRDRRMAIIAIVAAGQMRRVLASGGDAIVTGAATAQDLGMIHGIGRQPDY